MQPLIRKPPPRKKTGQSAQGRLAHSGKCRLPCYSVSISFCMGSFRSFYEVPEPFRLRLFSSSGSFSDCIVSSKIVAFSLKFQTRVPFSAFPVKIHTDHSAAVGAGWGDVSDTGELCALYVARRFTHFFNLPLSQTPAALRCARG